MKEDNIETQFYQILFSITLDTEHIHDDEARHGSEDDVYIARHCLRVCSSHQVSTDSEEARPAILLGSHVGWFA